MKIKDLYQMETDNETFELWGLGGSYYHHMREVEFTEVDMKRNRRVSIRVVNEISQDGRRIWNISTVWFHDVHGYSHPFMVIRNAGREGDDFYDRFITDGERYWDAVKYLRGLYEGDEVSIVRADDNILGLGDFYGQTVIDAHGQRVCPEGFHQYHGKVNS